MASIEAFLTVAGLALAALVLLLQQSGIPIPIPTPLIVIAVGLMAALGYAPLSLAFPVMLLALVIGGVIQYYLARGGGKPRSEGYGKFLGLEPEHLESAGKAIEHRGWLAIVWRVALPMRRNAVFWAAGVAHFPLGRFLFALVAGCAIFVAWNFVLAYLAVEFIQELRSWSRTVIFSLALALGVAISLLRWQFHLAAPESMSGLRAAAQRAGDSKEDL